MEGNVATAFTILLSVLFGALCTLAMQLTEIFDLTTRLILTCLIIISFVLGCILYMVFQDIKSQQELQNLISEWAETDTSVYLPNQIRYTTFKRVSEISVNGDVIGTWHLRGINLTNNDLSEIVLPERKYDIFDGNPTDEYEELIEIKVNDEELVNVKLEQLRLNKKFEHVGVVPDVVSDGRIVVVYRIPLPRRHYVSSHNTFEIMLKIKTRGIYRKILEKETTGMSVYEIRESITQEAVAPDGYRIELVCENEHIRGVKVCDIATNQIDRICTEKVDNPILIKNNTLKWTVNQPRINHRFIMYFRIVKI